MYGNHSIYNIVLVDNGIVNAIIYFVGAVIVLSIGFIYQRILNKSNHDSINPKDK